VIASAPHVFARGKAVLQVTTKLGVSKTITVVSFEIEGRFPREGLCTYRPCLPIKPRDGVYLAVWLGDIKNVAIQDGTANVTLSDGGELKGALVGSLKTGDDKAYSCNSLTKLEVVEPPAEPELGVWTKEALRPSEQTWTLSIAGQPQHFAIRNPRIAYGYSWTGSWGTRSYSIDTSSSFKIEVGGETLEASITDFSEVAVTNEKEMATEAADGTKTTGSLKFDRSEDAWGLQAGITGGKATVLLVEGQTFIVRRGAVAADPRLQ